jgi:hypothetical protein
MYTSILLVALTGTAPVTEGSKAPAWSHDYTTAGKEAVQAKKPLLVILAPGQKGYDKMGRDGGISADAKALLADKYVCVHIDTTTAKGQELARAFDFEGDTGIAISDVTGEKLAFYHEGDLANADLVRYLERYSDPNRAVEFTESNPGRRHHGGGGCATVSCGGGCGGYATCGTCGGGCGGGRHHRGHRSGCHRGGCGGGCR